MENKSVIVSATSSFSGPLPPPDDLAKYNDAVPDAAERIIAMAEKEQENRHRLQGEELKLRRTVETRGQMLGFVLALLFTFASVFLAYLGHLKLALAFGAPLIIGICSIFVLRKVPTVEQGQDN